MHFVLHKFRPTETIDGVIRLKGRHNFTTAEVVEMRKRFNELNGPVVPRAGDIFKIPLPFLTTDDFGEVVDVTPQPIEVCSEVAACTPETIEVCTNVPAPTPEPTSQPVEKKKAPTLSVGGRRRT